MLIVQPMATLTMGFHTPGESVDVLSDAATDAELGQAVSSAFAKSDALPIRADVNKSRPEQRASGLKTQREFMDGARHVYLTSEDGAVIAQPSRNESPRSPRGGFSFIDPPRSVDLGSDMDLGATVRQALADCTFATPVRPRRQTSDVLRR